MTALDSLVPKVADRLATKDDGKDQGDAPPYHHNTGNDRNDCEFSDRKDAMVEKEKRKLCHRNSSSKGDLRRPISLY